MLKTVIQFRMESSERHGETEKFIFLRNSIELNCSMKKEEIASDPDRTAAFVQSYRYVSFSKLWEDSEYTTELGDLD